MKNNLKISREECIYAICHFVIRYKEDKKYTPYEIYEETCYKKYYCDITQEQIIDVIRRHTNLIEAWLLFSQDKRWTPSWFFEKRLDGFWRVGYMVENGKYTYEMMFNDSVNACAQMIRMEMEEFRLRNSEGDKQKVK